MSIPKYLQKEAKGNIYAAVNCFCRECVGSLKEAESCANDRCFLWSHRPQPQDQFSKKDKPANMELDDILDML